MSENTTEPAPEIDRETLLKDLADERATITGMKIEIRNLQLAIKTQQQQMAAVERLFEIQSAKLAALKANA